MKYEAEHILYNSGLNAQESFVARARYGFSHKDELTFEEISELMGGVSRQYVHMVWGRANKKMKLFVEAGSLKFPC